MSRANRESAHRNARPENHGPSCRLPSVQHVPLDWDIVLDRSASLGVTVERLKAHVKSDLTRARLAWQTRERMCVTSMMCCAACISPCLIDLSNRIDGGQGEEPENDSTGFATTEDTSERHAQGNIDTPSASPQLDNILPLLVIAIFKPRQGLLRSSATSLVNEVLSLRISSQAPRRIEATLIMQRVCIFAPMSSNCSGMSSS